MKVSGCHTAIGAKNWLAIRSHLVTALKPGLGALEVIRRGGLGDSWMPSRQCADGHHPGRVAADVAVTLADGGETISDLAVLRDQPELFGPVASSATAWRVLDGIDESALARSRSARAVAGEVAWAPDTDTGGEILQVTAA